MPGTFLLPNDTKTILWVDSPENARKALVANAGRIKMNLTYCSVYEQCWEVNLDPQQLEQPEVPKQPPSLTFTASKEWSDGLSGTPAEHK